MKNVDVTKEQFDAFIASYPRPLKRSAVTFCEPPTIQYNDFSLGKWPDSVVAWHSFEDRAGTIPNDWQTIESPAK